jgi:hypothetical protein
MRRDLDDDDDVVVADGQGVRRRLMFKDSRRFVFDIVDRHRPGFRMAADAAVKDARREARRARQSWIQDMTSAWKRTPGRDAGPEPDLGTPPELMRRHLRTEESDEAQARRDASWRAYCDQLGRAWQNPGAANAVERQRERWTAEQ